MLSQDNWWRSWLMTQLSASGECQINSIEDIRLMPASTRHFLPATQQGDKLTAGAKEGKKENEDGESQDRLPRYTTCRLDSWDR